MSPSTMKRIRALRIQGLSGRKIAQAVGVPESSVHRAIRSMDRDAVGIPAEWDPARLGDMSEERMASVYAGRRYDERA